MYTVRLTVTIHLIVITVLLTFRKVASLTKRGRISTYPAPFSL
jgi:hypothetical protein